MPRGVKIGVSVVFALSAIVLAWSLYFNFYLVESGWVQGAGASLEGKGSEARLMYTLSVMDTSGRGLNFTVPYAELAGVQLGDRVQWRRSGERSARVIRSRRPNLIEMAAAADSIVEAVVVERPPAGQSLYTLKINDRYKPVAADNPGEEHLQLDARMPWFSRGDLAVTIEFTEGERVLLFLDRNRNIFAGATGVIRLTGQEISDVELGLRLPEEQLLQDLKQAVKSIEEN